MFCKDGIHFTVCSNKIFSLLIAQVTCIYSPKIYSPRCQNMADQTHCHICERHLRKGGIWCVICKAYIHVSCSGLQSSKFFFTMGSPAYNAPNGNFAKETNSTNRPTSTGPITTQKTTGTAHITTQKETSPSTPETNVLPNETQSYSSPQPSLQPPSTPGNLSTKNLKLK